MNHPCRSTLTAAVLLVFAGAAAAITLPIPSAASAPTAARTAPTQPTLTRPKASPTVKRILAAMGNASTWGHPDQFGEYAGMQSYSEGHYQDAIKYFKYGARYGDKLSELAIGLMYDNGRGVSKDPVTSCAWLALAAQIKSPGFIATRNRVCEALTPAQHDQAVALLGQLLPVYGDQAADHHMATALNLGAMAATGSHLGFNSGISFVPPSEFPMTDGGIPGVMHGVVVWRGGAFHPDANCYGPSLIAAVPVPKAGCGAIDFWVSARWNPKQYFKLRHEHWLGTVTVEPLQKAGAPASSAKTKPAPAGSDY